MRAQTQTYEMKTDLVMFLESIGIAWKFMISGFIGGTVWSIYKKSKFWEAVRQVTIGGIVSGYFTPVIVSKFSMDMSVVGFSAFIIGMTGMVIVDSIYKYISSLIKKWRQAVIFLNEKEV